MALQAGVAHPGHLRVLLQERRQLHGVGLGALHAQAQRLDAAQHQPGLVRVHGAAQVEVHLAQAGQHCRILGDDDAGHHVGVAVDELGHAVQHDVRTQLQRVLQERRGEGVVDDHQRAVLVGDRGAGREVGQLQGRVGRRLEVDQLGLRTHRPSPRSAGRPVSTKRRGDAEARVLVLQDHAAGAVEGVGGHDVRALAEEGEVDHVDRRHAGGRAPARRSRPPGWRCSLQRRGGRVAQARVHVAGLAAEAGRAVVGVTEGEGRGLVDRRRDGAGVRVGVLAGMDDAGHHAPLADVLHGMPFGWRVGGRPTRRGGGAAVARSSG